MATSKNEAISKRDEKRKALTVFQLIYACHRAAISDCEFYFLAAQPRTS